jgi:hypothetical protein
MSFETDQLCRTNRIGRRLFGAVTTTDLLASKSLSIRPASLLAIIVQVTKTEQFDLNRPFIYSSFKYSVIKRSFLRSRSVYERITRSNDIMCYVKVVCNRRMLEGLDEARNNKLPDHILISFSWQAAPLRYTRSYMQMFRVGWWSRCQGCSYCTELELPHSSLFHI